MSESADSISVLRRKIARIEGQRQFDKREAVHAWHEGIDAVLNGGIARGRLHEIYALESDDSSSAAGFVAMLGCGLGGNIVWLRTASAESGGGGLHAPGLCEAGIDPASLILAVLPDAEAVLRAGLDAVRCPQVGVAVVELWRGQPKLDLTASRRLAVAAEASGVTVLLLRIDAMPAPSAAQTRWSVRSAASTPLEADAPGHPAFEVELLRQRGGPEGGRWTLEWDRDRRVFRDRDTVPTALPGAVVPLSAGGPAGAGIVSIRRSG